MLPTKFDLEDSVRYSALGRGNLYLFTEIEPMSAHQLLMEMAYTIEDMGAGVITLYINSDGGFIDEALAIYDQIMYYRRSKETKFSGIVRGKAASSASMVVLQACDQRLATPHSRLHMHEPAIFHGDHAKASSVRDGADEITRLETVIYDILRVRMDMDEESLRTFLTGRERWLSASAAYTLGLLDGIDD